MMCHLGFFLYSNLTLVRQDQQVHPRQGRVMQVQFNTWTSPHHAGVLVDMPEVVCLTNYARDLLAQFQHNLNNV